MPSSSTRLDGLLLDLAWSQWTELGARGVARRHREWSLDPEALVVLTAALAAADPRLRDESVDWCLQFHRHLSQSRLRTLARRAGPAAVEDTERLIATVGEHGTGGWPRRVAPLPARPSGKSEPPDLRRPALLRLRLRAIFGVSARAELFHAFLAEPGSWRTAAELALVAGYTKRNVSAELESLAAAGVVATAESGNRRRYAPSADRSARELVGEVPARFLAWDSAVALMLAVRAALAEVEAAGDRVRDVEAAKRLDALRAALSAPDLEKPPEPGPAAWERLEEWALGIASVLAAGDDPQSRLTG